MLVVVAVYLAWLSLFCCRIPISDCFPLSLYIEKPDWKPLRNQYLYALRSPSSSHATSAGWEKLSTRWVARTLTYPFFFRILDDGNLCWTSHLPKGFCYCIKKTLNYVNKVKLVLEVAIMFYNIFIYLLSSFVGRRVLFYPELPSTSYESLYRSNAKL